jgi:hypothetical protein
MGAISWSDGLLKLCSILLLLAGTPHTSHSCFGVHDLQVGHALTLEGQPKPLSFADWGRQRWTPHVVPLLIVGR